LFRTNEHQSATPLIILLDITIGILFTFKDWNIISKTNTSAFFDRRNKKK
jgi:hypothetical protein